MPKQPIEIRNMFVSTVPTYGNDKNTIYDVGILTPDDRYVEYEFKFNVDRITEYSVKTIKSVFSDYRFTDKSSVCMTDNVSDRNPLYVYCQILAQQIGFHIKRTPAKKISDRMCHLIRGMKTRLREDKDLEKSHLYALWNYLVEKEKCGWITLKYDAYLSTLNASQRKRKKLVRIGVYYMRKRRLSYQYSQRSIFRAA